MTALILAGGRGSRLAPWHAPKCLLPMNGIPILHRLLNHLLWTENGQPTLVERAIICVGYRGSDVRASVSSLDLWERIQFSDAGLDAPMGKRLIEAGVSDRVLICYGDELADVDVAALIGEHEETGAKVTFAVHLSRTAGGAVDMRADSGQVRRIHDDALRLTNIGFAVVEPACWSLLQPSDGLSDWINRVAEDHFVRAHLHDGRRATVNSLADLQYAEEVWK